MTNAADVCEEHVPDLYVYTQINNSTNINRVTANGGGGGEKYAFTQARMTRIGIGSTWSALPKTCGANHNKQCGSTWDNNLTVWFHH